MTNLTEKQEQAQEQAATDLLGDIQCLHCVHANDDDTCKAFPQGIPLAIVSGRFDHNKPYTDDHGVRFKSI